MNDNKRPRPSCVETMREEIIRRAESGERIGAIALSLDIPLSVVEHVLDAAGKWDRP